MPNPITNQSKVRTYFDSYGDLRFCTPTGTLIHDRTPLMDDLIVISDILSSDSELHELMDNYEGSIENLHKLITTKYYLVR